MSSHGLKWLTRREPITGSTLQAVCLRCRKSLQVAARACHWIEQEFLRLFQPQTFVFAGVTTRHQGVHLDPDLTLPGLIDRECVSRLRVRHSARGDERPPH